MSRAVSFRQADIERLLRAAKAVGHENATVDVLPDGRLRLLTGVKAEPKALTPLEQWELEHGDRAA